MYETLDQGIVGASFGRPRSDRNRYLWRSIGPSRRGYLQLWSIGMGDYGCLEGEWQESRRQGRCRCCRRMLTSEFRYGRVRVIWVLRAWRGSEVGPQGSWKTLRYIYQVDGIGACPGQFQSNFKKKFPKKLALKLSDVESNYMICLKKRW